MPLSSAHPADEREDAGVPMTPMIDIVFQLLVFFLLTLRFKTVDWRVDAQLPRHLGPISSPPVDEDAHRIAVKLFRLHPQDAERAFTRIRIGQVRTIDLPPGGWTGHGAADAALAEARRGPLAEVAATIEEIRGRMGRVAEVWGEIRTPPPGGQAVPHGDVLAVLDAFLTADVTDVRFEGRPSPLPASR